MIVKLKFPLKFNKDGQNVEITEVSIQRMKVKHLKLIPPEIYQLRDGRKKKNIPTDKLLPLIAGLTGLSQEQFDNIDMVDLIPIVDEVMKIVGEALDRAG